ncbi:MAG: ATP-binding cassette domain-containing protein [Spirochaetales bacterium]
MNAETWVKLESCTIGDWRHRLVENLTWTWRRGESWVIEGPNGSGKSALVALFTGHLDAVAGLFERHSELSRAEEAWIGFERQRLLVDRERELDDSDYRDSPDPGTLVREFVGDEALLARFGLAEKADRGLKNLSTGELRRACLARAWRQKLPFLLLDEPFEGLDADGVALLRARLEEAQSPDSPAGGTDLAFLTQRADLAPTGLQRRWSLHSPVGGGAKTTPTPTEPGAGRLSVGKAAPLDTEPVLEFRHVNAGYGDLAVLKDFTWTVRRGERWLVTGPNGSGKSTLMALIAGDHPQVFCNDVRIAGRRRGPELTLDELRQEVALVSYSAHLGFRRLARTTGLEVMASGFAGTIGLWTEPRWSEVNACRLLAAEWGLEAAALALWEDLSWGTQRLLLLARALVAGQKLLLLDEPCQGLDPAAQQRFLNRVALWAQNPDHTLIYVTHRLNEIDEASFLRLQMHE